MGAVDFCFVVLGIGANVDIGPEARQLDSAIWSIPCFQMGQKRRAALVLLVAVIAVVASGLRACVPDGGRQSLAVAA